MYSQAAEISNKSGGEVEFIRFCDGQVGIIPNERTAKGHDLFDEYDFLKALWTLYPDGLPKPVTVLSDKEKKIREVTLVILESRTGESTLGRNYDDAMLFWDSSGPKARRDAEKVYDMMKEEEN